MHAQIFKSLKVSVMAVAATVFVTACGEDAGNSGSGDSRNPVAVTDEIELANGEEVVCNRKMDGTVAVTADAGYFKCKDGEWVKIKKLEALKADEILGEETEDDLDDDNDSDKDDVVPGSSSRVTPSGAEGASSSMTKSSSSRRSGIFDDEDDGDGRPSAGSKSSSSTEPKSSSETKSSSSGEVDDDEDYDEPDISEEQNTPITGCECSAESAYVDMNGDVPVEASWTVSGCQSDAPIISYLWDGTAGTENYVRTYTKKGNVSPKLVVKNSDNSSMVVACPAVKVLDSMAPDYLIEVVGNQLNTLDRIEVPSGACVQISGTWTMEGWTPSPRFHCDMTCRGECSMKLQYGTETTSLTGTYNVLGYIPLEPFPEIFDYTVCVEFQNYEETYLHEEKKDVTSESVARCYLGT